MTSKQHDFIVRLADEKDVASLSEAQRAFLPRVVDGTADLTPAQASRIIEALLALPRKAVADTSTPDVPAGRYAVVNPSSGVTEFFKVDRPEDGKWAGYVFVKQQASDDLYPVKGARRDEVLARIAVDHRAAMVLYGHELGACGNCGRTLTDEVSRAMGIGPDCAAKLGIERLSLGDVVTAAPSAPTGDVSDDEDYAFGGAARADAAAEEAAEREVVDVTRRPSGAKLGWRDEKRLVKEQQADRKRTLGNSQNADRPGCDIFGAPL